MYDIPAASTGWPRSHALRKAMLLGISLLLGLGLLAGSSRAEDKKKDEEIWRDLVDIYIASERRADKDVAIAEMRRANEKKFRAYVLDRWKKEDKERGHLLDIAADLEWEGFYKEVKSKLKGVERIKVINYAITSGDKDAFKDQLNDWKKASQGEEAFDTLHSVLLKSYVGYHNLEEIESALKKPASDAHKDALQTAAARQFGLSSDEFALEDWKIYERRLSWIPKDVPKLGEVNRMNQLKPKHENLYIRNGYVIGDVWKEDAGGKLVLSRAKGDTREEFAYILYLAQSSEDAEFSLSFMADTVAWTVNGGKKFTSIAKGLEERGDAAFKKEHYHRIIIQARNDATSPTGRGLDIVVDNVFLRQNIQFKEKLSDLTIKLKKGVLAVGGLEISKPLLPGEIEGKK